MLSNDKCEQLEILLHEEIGKRHKLGGYSPDAPTILMLCEICFELIRHIRESKKSKSCLSG